MTTNTPIVNSGSHVLIATLGGKPQVVTFALDCLLALNTPITHVFAVHLSGDPRIQRALGKLDTELSSYNKPREIKLHPIAIHAPRYTPENPSPLTLGKALEHIDDPEAATAIWLTMHRLISTLKSNDASIDLCLAGGPRLISLQALSVATLLFTPRDRCWHLYTPEELRKLAGEGDIMHLKQESGMRLISVPFVPMGMIFPNLQMAMYLSPEQIVAERTQYISDLEVQHCRNVAQQLTKRQRDVLHAFACAPAEASVNDVANQMNIAVATVNTHKSAILQCCRNEWVLLPDLALTHHFLHDKFGLLPDKFWAEFPDRHRSRKGSGEST